MISEKQLEANRRNAQHSTGPRTAEGRGCRRHPNMFLPNKPISAGPPASKVANLLTYSRVFQKQKWRKFHVKNGDNRPVVWEVKHAPLYRKQGDDGLPGGTHYLVVARNVLNRKELKYFVSNMIPGANGVTLEWLLWVAFSRWPIEKCFRQSKDELGMDHFEIRSWNGIHRHLYLSNLSLLFCANLHQNHNQKARFYHTKRTLQQLRNAGIEVARLPCCIPNDP